MKKILVVGNERWADVAIKYYGIDQIAYITKINDCQDERTSGNIPVINMKELVDEKFREYEVIVCVSDYWTAADLLDNMGVECTIFEPICGTWPPVAQNISHDNWCGYLVKMFDHQDIEILEIGSRVVTGSNLRDKFKNAKFTGIDIYPGENVDVMGDAHYLSTYFEKGKRFDLIISSAVFEHFAMPWIVAEEISKMLKVGGYFFVETHFSHSYHEKPWMFFQFSDMALRVLFNRQLGFEVIEAGVSNPIQGRFSCMSSSSLKGQNVNNLWCHSEIFGKKIEEPEHFSWNQVNIQKLVNGTAYPILEDIRLIQEKADFIFSSFYELLEIITENDLDSDIQFYSEVTEVLETSTRYLDRLWEQIKIEKFGIDRGDWERYSELVTYSRAHKIDLNESVLPFVRCLLERYMTFFGKDCQALT